MQHTMHSLVLIGMMGSGKSTVAQQLGARLRLPAVDTDALVEQASGHTIAALIKQRGEAAFRQLETQALQRALQPPRKVIASGGGIVLAAANRALLAQSATVVYLQASADVLLTRVVASLPSRPLLGGYSEGEVVDRPAVAARLHHLLAARQPLYQAAAQYTVCQRSTDTPAAVADNIIALLGSADTPPQSP